MYLQNTVLLRSSPEYNQHSVPCSIAIILSRLINFFLNNLKQTNITYDIIVYYTIHYNTIQYNTINTIE